ncbi:MAG: hypothetical protein V4659_13500 [Pseudomonadota bacterium]
MQIKIMLAASAAAAALAAVPASAQTYPEPAFDGPYVGAAVGYDVQPNDGGSTVLFDRNLDGRFGDTVLTGTGANAFAPSLAQPGAGFCNGQAVGAARSPGGCRSDKDDIGYYGRVGFDSQSGNIVVGVVAEFGTSDIRDSSTAFSVTPANYIFNREIDYEGSIRGRLGFTPNNSTLFYATGGPGYAKIDSTFSSSQSTNTFTGRGKSRKFGVTAGGGVEQRIGAFSFGLEYLHHRYQDDDYRIRVAGPGGTPFTNAANGGTLTGTDFRRSDDIFRWHSIRGTVGFHF